MVDIDRIQHEHSIDKINMILVDYGYFPVETDDEDENNYILKYSNNKSQLWVYVDGNIDPINVTRVSSRVTKKRGTTKVHAFKDLEELTRMINYFRDNKQYDNFLIFMLGLLLARRVGDTLSLKWEDIYYENGKKKKILNTLIEQKTDKIIEIAITDTAWKYIDWYCKMVNIDPMAHYTSDIFYDPEKELAKSEGDMSAYKKAINKQAARYRYAFKKAAAYCGIEGVSTHSTRKTFVYLAHQLNKFDPDNWQVLQSITGHNDIEDVKRYSDIMDEKATQYFNDVNDLIYDIDHGVKPALDNTPVVSMRTNDLIKILKQAYRMGQDESLNAMDAFEDLLKAVDTKRLVAI